MLRVKEPTVSKGMHMIGSSIIFLNSCDLVPFVASGRKKTRQTVTIRGAHARIESMEYWRVLILNFGELERYEQIKLERLQLQQARVGSR